MGLVEGVRGPDPIRYCDCGVYKLQLVASFVGWNEDGSHTKEPVEFSHWPTKCPVCLDKEAKGELGDATGARVA